MGQEPIRGSRIPVADGQNRGDYTVRLGQFLASAHHKGREVMRIQWKGPRGDDAVLSHVAEALLARMKALKYDDCLPYVEDLVVALRAKEDAE